jgi:hypothetical protein
VFRVLTATALLGSLVFTAGCNDGPGEYEVITEVVGTNGAVVESITVTAPGSKPDPAEGEHKAVPFKRGYVLTSEEAKKGDFSITAKPTKGALTCVIVVDKKEVKKVAGAEGEAVTCATKVAA